MEEVSKVEGEHFDLIIANPPYGKIGANITKKIIDTIDFGEYVNLLPVNDYKRNDTHDLYKYVDIDSMKPVSRGFKDAAVTTHVARIAKKPNTYISWDEFQIENYIDESLSKYFYENTKRSHYAIDAAYMPLRLTDESAKLSPTTSIIIGIRDVNHKHMPYEKNSNTYKWNVLKNITINDIVILHPEKKTANEFMHQFISFNTEVEKNNFSQFMYSANGFKFLAKVFTAVNIDGATKAWKVFPKVDWTREWTVEEILADYGYTEKEIKEVMDDLVNFKGMEE